MPSITVSINSMDELYNRYLPLTRYGGVFIKTDRVLDLDTPLTVNLQISIEDLESVAFDDVEAAVSWVNFNSTKNRPQGIGIRFTSENAQAVHDTIIKLLGERLNSYQPTFML